MTNDKGQVAGGGEWQFALSDKTLFEKDHILVCKCSATLACAYYRKY